MSTISTLLSILLIIAFFGVMIFVHELGHFITARLCHVRVLEFAIGMGPKILSRTSKKSGTVYSLRLFPIGGFCSMLGEDRDDSVESDPSAFCNRPRWQRFLVLVSGAGMNLLVAFLAMCTVLCINGSYVSNTVKGFYIPSYAGGLQIDDVITYVNDTPVETEEELHAAIKDLKTNLAAFTVERDGEEILLPAVGLPQYREGNEFYRMADFVVSGQAGEETRVVDYHSPSAYAGLRSGDVITHVNGKKVGMYTDISWEILLAADTPCSVTVNRADEEGNFQSVTIENVVFPVESVSGVVVGTTDFALEAKPNEGFFNTLKNAFNECVSNSKLVYRSLIQLIAGRFGTAGVSGPIGVAGTISEVASLGFLPLLQLFVIININLGIFNLLPLPALDGGRLLFVVLEMIRRKPVNPKYEATIHAVGMILLLALSVFIAAMDISRLIGG